MSIGRLEAYIVADRELYDSPRYARFPRRGLREPADVVLPSGWHRRERGVWDVFDPPGARPPVTGWKVHVAACPETAAAVSDVVVPYCLDNGVPFKRLASLEVVHLMAAKYAPRSGSGKYVTVYPDDDAHLVRLCRDLHPELAGLPGPRVLTDVTWREGPLSARYGAVRGRPYVDEDGRPGTLMRDADGTWVPDGRRLGGRMPEGVRLPEGFEVAAPAPAGAALGHLTDLVALHHSNSGGVYKAWATDTRRWVVLKEARPLSGYDREGRTAPERLEREAQALERLKGVAGVPGYLGRLEVQGHEFLVEEFVEGLTLVNWAGVHSPTSSRSDARPDELRDWARRADRLVGSVAAVLEGVHGRGLAMDDLHPGNVLVGASDEVCLIDFEAASELDRAGPGSFYGAGFGGGRATGRERDLRALDMLALWLLLPLTRITDLDPTLLPEHVAWVRATYPVPPSLDARLARLLAGPAPVTRRTVDEDRLVAGIAARSTPHRDDRLHPGSAESFTFGGTCLAYGAAGVLWATAATGREPRAEDLAWFVERLDRRSPYRGLFVGDAGVAVVAHRLGLPRETLAPLVDGLLAEPPDGGATLGLYAGAAGDGLAMLHLGTGLGEDRLVDGALSTAERCAAALRGGRRLSRAGYLHGWAGVAQLFLAVHRHTGSPRWLGHAVDALGQDLERCTVDDAAGVRVAMAGVRRIAYLGEGSGGIALVADEVLDHAEVPALEGLLPGLAQACRRTVVAQPGLLAGRAGLLAVVARLLPRLRGADDDAHGRAVAAVEAHRRLLGLHTVARGDAQLVPGEGGLRLSADLAHGSAGVLLALHQARAGGAFLPFFTSRPPVPTGTRTTGGGVPR